jgi:hypothetical protein
MGFSAYHSTFFVLFRWNHRNSRIGNANSQIVEMALIAYGKCSVSTGFAPLTVEVNGIVVAPAFTERIEDTSPSFWIGKCHFKLLVELEVSLMRRRPWWLEYP